MPNSPESGCRVTFIAGFSGVLHRTYEKDFSRKLEFLALKWTGTDRFIDYFNFGPPFEVFTANNPLTNVMTTAKLNACGLRWSAQLANYQFTIRFRSGKTNIDADFLSRNPTEEFQKIVIHSRFCCRVLIVLVWGT